METLIIKREQKHPGINFNPNGELALFGRSIPENSMVFYKPAIEWMKQFAELKPVRTIMTVKLEYFNTSSSKCILELFKELEKLYKGGSDVKIIWEYEEDDEDIFEAGQDYDSIVRVPFEFKELMY